MNCGSNPIKLYSSNICRIFTIIREANQSLTYSAFVCLLLGAIARVPAAEYEVDGQIEQTIYKRDGSVGALEKSQFTVFVRDCSWLIQTTQSNTNGKPVVATETACVNGTEIYEVSGGMATIVSNTVPVGQRDGYFVCHLWQMFASSCYFKDRTNSWLTPAYDLNASANVEPDLKRKGQWDLIDGQGSLPRSVVYYQDSGSVDATYTATGVTNAGTIKIPSGFMFERKRSGFGVEINAQGKPVTPYPLRKRAVATVTAVRPVCSRKDLTPTAKGRTMVIDQRAWQEPASKVPVTVLKYYVANDGVQWLPFEQAKKAYVLPHVPPKPIPRGIIVAILLLPTILFASFWLLTRKRG